MNKQTAAGVKVAVAGVKVAVVPWGLTFLNLGKEVTADCNVGTRKYIM